MAVIGKIRKHSVILLLIVAIALLAFILGDFIKPGNSGLKEFITIDKDKISYYDYMDKYNYYSGLLKENNAENIEYEANNYTYNEMVDSIVLSKQLIPLGISVTAEELNELMAGDNPHPDARRFFGGPDGKYDKQIAQGFLANMEQYDSAVVAAYLYWETAIEKQTLLNKYLNLLGKSYYLPKVFARKLHEETEMKAHVQLTHVPYTNDLVSDDKIKFTEDDIKQWYEKNLYRFPQDQEMRNIDYVIFEILPSEQDLQEIENDIRQKYDEFLASAEPEIYINSMIDSRYDSTFFKQNELPSHIDTLLINAPIGTLVEPFIEGDYWMFAKLLDVKNRPDSIHVNFIFVAKEGMQNAPRKGEESKLLIDSAFMALLAGQNFYEVANQFSDFKPDPQNDSARVWLADGSSEVFFDRSTAQSLFDTLYQHVPGTMTKYESQFGTWIFIVNHRTTIEKKIQVAIGKRIIDASTETFDNIESAANNFVNGTDNYEKFDKKVKDLNLNKRNFERLTAMAYTIPGITSNAREIIRWAFDEDTKKGTVSNVFHLDNVFVVATLKSIYPKGHMDLEQVRTFAETMVKRDKKAEKLSTLLTASMAKSKNLQTIASQYKSTVDTVLVSFTDRNFGHYGPEPGLIGKIFAQKPQSGIQLMKGDMGMYVLNVVEIKMPSSLQMNNNQAQNTEMQQQQQSMMYQNKVQNSSMPSLKKVYKIVDNRYKVF